jgi:hypothetical protein
MQMLSRSNRPFQDDYGLCRLQWRCPGKGMFTCLNMKLLLILYQQFDAVKLSHLVDAEYGNQGIDFKMVPREGFGWMNGQ